MVQSSVSRGRNTSARKLLAAREGRRMTHHVAAPFDISRRPTSGVSNVSVASISRRRRLEITPRPDRRTWPIGLGVGEKLDSTGCEQ